MILLIREDEVLQVTNEDDEILETEFRNGAQIYRFEPCFFKYQRYIGNGGWEYLPFSHVKPEGDD